MITRKSPLPAGGCRRIGPEGRRRCMSSANAFKDALQQSRLAAMPQQETDGRNNVPTHQVLTSTPASNHRKDFGLKRAMPTTLRSRYIVARKLDTPFGFADFEPGSSKALILKRLQSLNLPVIPIPRRQKTTNRDLSPLFFGSTPRETTRWDKLTKRDFEQWLKTTKRTGNAENLVHEFTQSSKRSNFASHSPIANAGFSYTLPGVLKNSPQGPYTKCSIPGRLLNKDGRQVAAAGLVAADQVGVMGNSTKDPARVHQQVGRFAVDRLRVNHSGYINMYLQQDRSPHSNFIQPPRRKLGHSFEPAYSPSSSSSQKANSFANDSSIKNAYYESIKRSLFS